MTKRQKIISHLVFCYRKYEHTDNLKAKYYWQQQIKKGLIIVNIKPW